MSGCNIAKNDIKQKVIVEEIKNKSNELKNRYINVRKLAVENNLFQSVLNDYEKYYYYIIDEKQKQYNAFKVISEYLDELIMNTDMLNSKALYMKEDQYHILKKLDDIRGEMEEITNEKDFHDI